MKLQSFKLLLALPTKVIDFWARLCAHLYPQASVVTSSLSVEFERRAGAGRLQLRE